MTAARRRWAHVVVIGNEKGGSGKTTIAMHLAVALLRLDFAVATLDLDSRQRSLTRYIENRRAFSRRTGRALPVPGHRLVERISRDSAIAAQAEERESFLEGLAEASRDSDFVVIDCPGAETFLARLAHLHAQTLLTPVNDSFLDLDPLVELRPGTREAERLGVYLQMLWELRQDRRSRRQPPCDWVVTRNRVGRLADINSRKVEKVLERIGPTVGFRLGPPLAERTVYRLLFPDGLTALDTGIDAPGMSFPDVAAEINALLAALWLPGVQARLDARPARKGAAS